MGVYDWFEEVDCNEYYVTYKCKLCGQMMTIQKSSWCIDPRFHTILSSHLEEHELDARLKAVGVEKPGEKQEDKPDDKEICTWYYIFSEFGYHGFLTSDLEQAKDMAGMIAKKHNQTIFIDSIQVVNKTAKCIGTIQLTTEFVETD